MTRFDKVAEKAVDILASGIVISAFTIWMVVHNGLHFNYTNFISDVAIWIGLLILRAENVQSTRLEKKVEKGLKWKKRYSPK